MIDIIIATFKFLGMVLTGAFGIIGLIVEFKDDNGRVTKHGRTALILIIVSTIVAIGAHSLEFIRDQEQKETQAELRARETLESVKRTEKLINEINRGLHSISEVSLRYWISIPNDHIQMRSYIERLKSKVPEIVSKLENEEHIYGIDGTISGPGRNVEGFSFNASSPLSPDEAKEKFAHTILGYAGVELQFYKKPISVNEHPAMSNNWSNKPDLRLSVSSGLDSQGLSGAHSIDYELKSGEFTLGAHRVNSDPKYWDSTGNIVGIPDLLGSQLFIRLPSVIRSGDIAIDQYLPDVRRRFQLNSLIVSFSKGREFRFRKKMLEVHRDKDGYPLYVYTLPSSIDELSKLQR